MTTVHEPETPPSGDPLPYPYPRESSGLDVDAVYTRLLEEQPVVRVQAPFGEEAWLVTRDEDVRTVLADPRFSRAMANERDAPRFTPDMHLDSGIMAMDPPDHRRLRRLVAKAFTSRRVELLRPRVQEITDLLVDDMIAAGPPQDLVSTFAVQLPIRVITELLGVPDHDRPDIERWTEAVMSTTFLTPEERGARWMELGAYITEMIAKRREQPTADLVSGLVAARDEEGGFSEEELTKLIQDLIVGGFETSTTQITNFVYTLLRNPTELRRLREDPSLVESAVEELLRAVPLGSAVPFVRYAREDVTFGDITVKAGEPVFPHLPAANNDPKVYACPHQLDVGREHNPHLAFGYGAHHCVGAQLARVELQIALATLLRRFPELSFAVPEEEIPWKSGSLTQGPIRLPLTW